MLLVGTTIIPRMMILDLLFHNNIIRCASLQGKESARPSIWERSIEKEREGKGKDKNSREEIDKTRKNKTRQDKTRRYTEEEMKERQTNNT